MKKLGRGQVKFVVEFDEEKTDLESVTTAFERLLDTAMETPNILDEYGPVAVGEFFCAEVD